MFDLQKELEARTVYGYSKKNFVEGLIWGFWFCELWPLLSLVFGNSFFFKKKNKHNSAEELSSM
uniref:Uncharacterized protein n=1 Tax=Rhizophora mucronata TaxID=61149 RepID=A0A2P2K2E1_RHIMU